MSGEQPLALQVRRRTRLLERFRKVVRGSGNFTSLPSRGSGREFHIRKDRIKSARYPHLRSLFDHPLHFAHDFVPIFPLSSAFGTSCTKGGSSGSGADRLKRFGAGSGRSGSVSSVTLRTMESLWNYYGWGKNRKNGLRIRRIWTHNPRKCRHFCWEQIG